MKIEFIPKPFPLTFPIFFTILRLGTSALRPLTSDLRPLTSALPLPGIWVIELFEYLRMSPWTLLKKLGWDSKLS